MARLMWETWMPYVRGIIGQWQPRNCIPMVDFLDSWGHLIPIWILDNILDQLVFPKLQKEVGRGPCSRLPGRARGVWKWRGCLWPGFWKVLHHRAGFCSGLQVESWNPLTDTVPIHSWIHPWLPLMQARLEPLYSPIRQKLANALQKWHPSDSSAKLILQPWKEVFTPGSWEAFMVKNIVPKLGQ